MNWTQKIAMARAKSQMKKLYKKYMPQLQVMKVDIGDLLDQVPEKNQLHVLIIICAEAIAGLEERKEQEFVLEGVKKTLELLNKNDK